MKGIGWIIGVIVGIVLLVAAWRTAFPTDSALVAEAKTAAEAKFGVAASEATEHRGVRSNAVCGVAGGQRFIYVNGRLHSSQTMAAEQLAALETARCREPLS